jgi:DNA-binding SARP family transcriptional activator
MSRQKSLMVRLFGPPEILFEGNPATGFDSDKVRALLAYLAVENDRSHRRERLAGLLWPEFTERSARTNLRHALANLRQVIDDHQANPPYLLITRQTIQFNVDSDFWLDVAEFMNLTEGKRALIEQLEEAVGLYRGDFLEGFSLSDSAAFEEWSLLQQQAFLMQAIDVYAVLNQ